MSARAVIEFADVSRSYGSPPTLALRNVDLAIEAGELTAIVGPSGSGKSTMLHLMGTLDRASSGTVRIEGIDVGALGDRQLSALRAHRLGFVFQQFHLADGVDALDNVATGLLYTGVPRSERRKRAADALRSVGLGHRLGHEPRQLSGGERQRVAIARAVVGRPAVLLADEPTGALDTASGAAVIDVLERLNAAGTTVVVITHDRELASRMPRRIGIRDGRIEADRRASAAPATRRRAGAAT